MIRSLTDGFSTGTATSRAHRRGDSRAMLLDLAVLLILGLAIRVAGLPFAGHDSLDHALRTWMSLRWAEDPFPLTWGVWGPLHFYLIGGFIKLTGDIIWTPTLLHVGLGALIPPVVYLFTLREFGSRSGALVASIAFALYPAAVLNSLSVRSETPFALLLGLCMLALSRGRREPSFLWPVLGGLALTIASGMRYEGWMLTPFLALVLWPNWRSLLVFMAVAAIWPVISMASNLAVYGHPLWGIHQASQLELYGMGKADFSILQQARQFGIFVARLIAGMTPLLALAAFAGALFVLVRRHAGAVWLIPVAGLSVLLFAAAIRGTLVPKVNYTETMGLLLIPYVGALVASRQVQRLGGFGALAFHGLLFGSMAALLLIGTLRDLPGMRERSRIVRAIPAISPVPVLPGQATLDELAPAINAAAGRQDQGFILDFLGFFQTGYLGLHSLVHPDRVLMAPLAPNSSIEGGIPELIKPLRYRNSPFYGPMPGLIEEFLPCYPTGVVVLQPGSRFAATLQYEPGGKLHRGEMSLSLEELTRVPWPLPPEPVRLAPGFTPGAMGELVVYRYSLDDADRYAVPATCPVQAR
jgi:hypothetical protein